jgi:hypothetical protein
MNKQLIFISIMVFGILYSCKPKEKDLDNLMDEMINLGFTGKFDRPEKTLEKAALSLFGVSDYLAFTTDQNSFIVIDFKSEDIAISEERIETLFELLEKNVTTEDNPDFQILKENWRDHVYQNKNFMVAWEKERPSEVIEIIGKY